MSYWTELSKAVTRINSLMDEAQRANRLPKQNDYVVESLSIRDDYNNRNPLVVEAAKKIREQTRDEFRARGEAERDAIHAKCAREIETLRDWLSQISGRAIVDLGVHARAIAESGTKDAQ